MWYQQPGGADIRLDLRIGGVWEKGQGVLGVVRVAQDTTSRGGAGTRLEAA